VSLRVHPESERLRSVLARCADVAVPLSRLVFRCTTVEFATREDLLSGVGSLLYGGCWSPLGGFPAVYGSLDHVTMVEETYGLIQQAGCREEDLRPRVVVAIEAHLRQVLDLTDNRIRRRLRVSRKSLINEPWRDLQSRGMEALTQSIGRLAWELNWEGLLVPS